MRLFETRSSQKKDFLIMSNNSNTSSSATPGHRCSRRLIDWKGAALKFRAWLKVLAVLGGLAAPLPVLARTAVPGPESSALVTAAVDASGALAPPDKPNAPPAAKTGNKSDLEELTVIGAHALIPMTTPYSASTVTAETIETLSPGATVTVQTLLNSQPSIIATTDGPLGTRSNVFFRAFNSGQFAETFDGVSVDDVFNAGATNESLVVNNVLITPNNIDGVEVYRGINNPAVNSYISLGGTINYLPRRPTGTFGGEIDVSYGSFNTKQWGFSINTPDFHGLKQLISFKNGQSDGWNQNNGDRNNNFYYAADFARSNGDALSVYAVYNNNTGYTPFNMPAPLLQQYGSSYQWPTSETYESDKDRNWMILADYKMQINSMLTFQSKVFGSDNDFKRTSFSNPAFQESAAQPYNLGNDDPLPFAFWLSYPNGPTYNPAAVFPDANGDAQAGLAYQFYGYSMWMAGYSPSLTLTIPHNTITVGGNTTYGALHSRSYQYGAFNMPMITGYNDAWDEYDKRVLGSVYGQDEIALLDDRLHVTPGLKYIYAYTRNHDAIGFYNPISGPDFDTQTYVAPSIGLNFAPMDGLAVYAAFGQNIKFPDISAFYQALQTDSSGNNVIAPVKVKPEHVNDYEAGVRYRGAGFSGSVNLYRENFTDTFINSTTKSGLTLTQNGGAARYQGVELQLSQNLPRLVGGDANVYFNYSHNQAKFTTSFIDVVAGLVAAGQPLADVPEDLISTGVVWRHDGWRLQAQGRYVGRQYVDQINAGTPTSNVIHSYFVLDLGFFKTVEMQGYGGIKSIRFAVNADNLLDRNYLNEAFTDTDYYGKAFIRGVHAAPQSFTGSIKAAF
jgi:iron complex outermembrane receptor protein